MPNHGFFDLEEIDNKKLCNVLVCCNVIFFRSIFKISNSILINLNSFKKNITEFSWGIIPQT